MDFILESIKSFFGLRFPNLCINKIRQFSLQQENIKVNEHCLRVCIGC